MSFASLIGKLSKTDMRRLRALAEKAEWRDIRSENRCYQTAEVTDFWEPCSRAFFIRIPPGGVIHRHNDEAIRGITHHLVLSSNVNCWNGWLEGGKDRQCHLRAGHRYVVQREPVHWATNDGRTDRIHLLVEYGVTNASATTPSRTAVDSRESP